MNLTELHDYKMKELEEFLEDTDPKSSDPDLNHVLRTYITLGFLQGFATAEEVLLDEENIQKTRG